MRRSQEPLSKQAAEFKHAKRRALERYGLDLNKDRYLQMCRSIQEGRGTHCGKQSNRLSVWKVSFEGAEYPVVYDKLRHRIVTFLPPDADNAWGVPLKEIG